MKKITQGEFDDLIQHVSNQFDGKLPGKKAHLLLAPEIRKGEIETGAIPSSAQEGAVLILLYYKNESLYTAVILRNEYDGVHSGQISLPGGKAETTDSNFSITAIRETHEEIGVQINFSQIIGQLSTFYVIPSNFVIYPFVAILNNPPEFVRDPTEVQKVIEIDILNELTIQKVVYRELVFRNSFTISAPGFLVSNEFMWGATAMIFSELIAIINKN